MTYATCGALREMPTWWSVGFRVKTSAWQERGRALRAKEAVCGRRCGASLGKCDPVGCSLRMSLLSELEGLTGYSKTWKRSATPAGRSWWALGRSEPRTDGSESGSWPISTAEDSRASGAAGYSTESGRHPGTTLTDAANGLWASPQARDWKDSGPTQGNRKRTGGSPDHGLDAVARAGPLDQGSHSTSGRSRDWPNLVSTSPTGGRHGFDGGAGARRKLTLRGVLNGRWAAQLMGYPSDWLDVPTESLSRLWATPSSRRSSRRSAGQSSE